ncbi:MAG TPA: hypothetical protein VKY31_07410, partial [Terriglobia bacterium]|nr:hypothetical protein [Terriglobia bacterium]
MSLTICISSDMTGYPGGGGHQWVFLNWALGFLSLGCRVILLERIPKSWPRDAVDSMWSKWTQWLAPYGLDRSVAVLSHSTPLPSGCLTLEDATAADLLLNFRYGLSQEIVNRFRRTGLVDIDPGLLQLWISAGQVEVAKHDHYFTTGETVGRPGSGIPSAGLEWRRTRPCVALDWWPVQSAADDAPFTTVSHWYADEWVVDEQGPYSNDKRSGFLPFLDLPGRTSIPLELALCLGSSEEEERASLVKQGWHIKHSSEVAGSAEAYR